MFPFSRCIDFFDLMRCTCLREIRKKFVIFFFEFQILALCSNCVEDKWKTVKQLPFRLCEDVIDLWKNVRQLLFFSLFLYWIPEKDVSVKWFSELCCFSESRWSKKNIGMYQTFFSHDSMQRHEKCVFKRCLNRLRSNCMETIKKKGVRLLLYRFSQDHAIDSYSDEKNVEQLLFFLYLFVLDSWECMCEGCKWEKIFEAVLFWI